MLASYRSHPAFVFATSQWELPPEKVNAFSDAYLAAKHLGDVLAHASRDSLHQHCFAMLDEVFAHLAGQCSDDYESAFLSELKSASNRLLQEELIWYSLPRNRNFIALSAKAQQAAIQMQSYLHCFGQLPGEVVNEILDHSKSTLEQFRANAASGYLTRENLSINDGEVVRNISNVLTRAFAKSGVLDVVGTYTGHKTRVVGVSLEMSVPQATWWKNAIPGLARPPETLYAHLDETISCPKSIVYLSDVAETNGPTSCYPKAYSALGLNPLQEIIGRIVGTVGSNPDSILEPYYEKQYHQSVNSENFRRHFMRLPEAMRFNSHLGWDVMPESDLERQLTSKEKKMLGPAGTYIVFDGARLLHRGGLMEQGERIALQVVFSDAPPSIGKRIYKRLKKMIES